MAIKEVPTNFRVYYTCMKESVTKQRLKALEVRDDLENTIATLKDEIGAKAFVYRDNYNINILDYEEFKQNKYIDGKLYKVARGVFINKKDNYNIVSDLYDLYNYAKKQKEIYMLNHEISHYDKLLGLSMQEYGRILNVFYTEVHRQMILNGFGYVFEGSLGWICINRCHKVKSKPTIDFAATKKRKQELLAQGKKLYNKEEAEWCKARGIDYDGVDGRVYLTNEYCYEVPLIDCHIPHGSKYKLTITDNRSRAVRGKTNEELVEEANYDKEYLCSLPVDLKTKLTLCNMADKTLYTNFIRNENQKPLNATSPRRKDRQ